MSHMQPLISILIPAFNAQEWIADTIRSALAQTWPRIEIIVVDDGSRDRTLSVARQFVSKQVCVVTQPNQGAAATRNRAFSLSQGDFVQWLDADDLLSGNKIESQMAALGDLQERRTLLSCGWGYFDFRPEKARFQPTALWCDLAPVEWLLRKMELNLHMQTATWLVSRELTEAAGPWDTKLLGDDDGEYFCRVILASKGIRFVSDAKVFYRRPSAGHLSYIGRSDRKMEAQVLSMELNVSQVRSVEDNERVRSACVRYLQNWLLNFYPERPDLVERLERLARVMGGSLKPPHLSWKYAWIQKTFGWSAAKRTQLYYNIIKSRLLRTCDHALLRLGV
jgi:glycosyltransferase involved in cell wall biosynthesis